MKRLKKMMSSKVEVMSFVLTLVLACFYLFQFFDSNYKTEPLVLSFLSILYSVLMLFLGSSSLPYSLTIFSLVIIQFMTFTDYIAFVMMCLVMMIKKKWTIPILALYIISVVIVCFRHDKTSIHLAIHFMTCAGIYLAFRMCSSHLIKPQKKINVTESEKIILSQLAEGKMQKQVEGFSENTVSKKLRLCRERNGCVNNEELIALFKTAIDVADNVTESKDNQTE